MANLGIEVPQNLIESVVIGEIAKQLGKSEEIVEQVVRTVFTSKKNNYDRRTVFEETFATMVQEMAKELIREYLEQNRDKLRAAMMRELKSARTQSRIADGMIQAFEGAQYSVNVSLVPKGD